jgi:hypothetical protein
LPRVLKKISAKIFTYITLNGKISKKLLMTIKVGLHMKKNDMKLKEEMFFLKEELYCLIGQRPLADKEVLKISKKLDSLILKFYKS